MADSITSIPELLAKVRRDRRTSLRALALYVGVAHSSLSMWAKGTQLPDAESCAKLAAYSGYPETFVLQLAGRFKPTVDIPQPVIEIDPELGLLIRRFSPSEQREYLLPILKPAVNLAWALREERTAYDAGEPTPPEGAEQ